MVALAGQMLNLVLQDLVLNKNLKVNRVTQLVTIGPASYGPYTLEPDYLRTYDMFYPLPTSGVTQPQANGIPQFLRPVTMEQLDEEFKDPSTANYPYEFATDLSTQAQVWSGGTPGNGTLVSAGNLFIYPQSSGNIILTHRYMVNQPDMVAPESSGLSPWFAYDDYLVRMTASRLMGITGDDREKEYRESSLEMLRPHLIMEGDEQATVQRVKLDPRHFHSTRGLKPTKATAY
jgi:hypothetical protein